MPLSIGQFVTVQAARNWFYSLDDRPLFIQGYAGTGKTTVLQTLVGELGLNAAYLAFTGKAVSVMRSKLDNPAWLGTIHQATYRFSVTGEEARYAELLRQLRATTDPQMALLIRQHMRGLITTRFVPRDEFAWDSSARISLVVIDEASMVREDDGANVMRLARAAGIKVIAVGDPAQLPPVGGRPFFRPEDCNCPPVLTEVMRQEAGSPILALATEVRQGHQPRYGNYGPGLHICRRRDLRAEWIPHYNQILCGSNATRKRINLERRTELDVAHLPPQPGERMIVLANDHGLGVMNGEIFTVVALDDGDIVGRFDDGRTVPMPMKLETDEVERGAKQTYAYAITCHKAQGSEFPSVLVYNDGFMFKEDAVKWTYTAVTRASSHLTLLHY